MTLQAAIAAHRAGDLDQAEALYRLAIAGRDAPAALANLGMIHAAQGRAAEAEAAYLRAIELRPSATARRNLANLYMRTGRLDEAEAAYLALIAEDAEDHAARHSLGNLRLWRGDPTGWWLYSSRPERLKCPAKGLSYPEWDGRPLTDKRLFIYGEQGFGDQIFAARYIAGLGAKAVTLTTAPQLASLFRQLPAAVVPRVGKLSAADHDYWTQPLSLPCWAEPAETPYLRVEPRQAGGVGLMGRGNIAPDPGRSLPEDITADLQQRLGAISLQPEDTGAIDFRMTAGIVAGLDFVVTIDTSVAHLAGALGRPGVVLLQHHSCDWRWRADSRGYSIWYPSLRVVRQPSAGDWQSAIEEVVASLA